MISGQKVVCINDTFPDSVKDLYKHLPKKDVVYVIRDIGVGIGWNMQPEVVVYLVGLVNPNSTKPPYPERGFNAERFAPLQGKVETGVVEEEIEAEALV